MSVFKVMLSMFSWKTTNLLTLGALPAVNAFDTIVVLVAVAGAVAYINTAPLLPGPSEFTPEPFPRPPDNPLSVEWLEIVLS